MVDSFNDQVTPSDVAEQNTFEDHIALIHDSSEEKLSAITPLIKVGLEKGELCLYVSNREDNRDVIEALRAQNIDVEKAVSSGGLILTNKKEVYFKLGRFDPDWTVRVINNMAELAKKYKFTAMRVISEMSWILDKMPGVERWPEYEAKLNTLDTGIPMKMICQYDRQAFPPEALLVAIKTHPKVVSQGSVNKNHFYLPADLLLKGDFAKLDVEKMLTSIMDSSHTEAELHDREVSLQQLNEQLEKEAAARRDLEQAMGESLKRTEEKEAEVESRDQRIQALEQDIALLKSAQAERDATLGSIQEALRSSQDDTQKAAEALDKLRDALKSREQEITAAKAALDLKAAELEQQSVSMALLQKDVADRDEELISLRAFLDQEKAGRATVDTSLVERVAAIERLESEAASQRQEMERLEAELNGAKLAYSTQSEELARINEQARQLEERLNALKAERDEGAAVLSTLQETLAAKDQELAAKGTLLAEAVALCEGAKADTAFRSEEIDRLSGEVQQRDARLAELQATLSALSAQTATSNDQLTALRADLVMKEMAVSANLVQIERLNTDLKASLSELDALKGTLLLNEQELLDKRNAIGELQAMVKGRDTELAELRASYLVIQEDLRTAREAIQAKDTALSGSLIALNDSGFRYRALFEQAGVGMARLDLEGHLIEANDKFYDMLGYDQGDLTGRSFRDFTHRDDLVTSATMYRRLASGEASTVSGMKRYIRKLGASVWGNVSMSLVRDSAGLPNYIMAIIEDRTDQMLAEQLLREKEEKESEEQYKNIIETAPQGVWVLDPDGLVTFANKQLADMLGYTVDEMISQPAKRFLNAQWQEEQGKGIEDLSNEVKLLKKDTTDLWVIMSSMPIVDNAGQKKGTVGFASDITSLKSKEERFDAYLDEAEKAASRLQAVINIVSEATIVLAKDGKIILANPAAEKKVGAKGLVGKYITEFWPNMVLNDPDGINISVNGVDLKLIPTELRDGEEELGMVITVNDIAPIEAAVPAPEAPASHSESIAHDLNDSLTVIMGSVSLAKEYVIPEGRMYNKLKQIESASETARDLASKLISSNTESEAAAPAPGPALIKGKGRILLMDDEESVLEATGDLLRYLGYAVDVARDGEEALAMCREARQANQPFDLAILDLAIASGMGGKEASHKLREENPGMKLVVSSGFSSDPVLHDPTANGFDAAIPKPYAAERLSQVTAEVLSRK